MLNGENVSQNETPVDKLCALIRMTPRYAEFAQDFDLRPSLDKNGNQSGRLTWGFNFQKVNNNSYSPVFKLESGELIPLN
jgi:hypothetical protein